MLHPLPLNQQCLIPSSRFPYKIGYDLAGTVVAIGTAVTTFKVGDEIYGRAGNPYRGTIAEYALTTASASALKPKTLTFSQAAAIPLAAQTVLQCLDRGDRELAGGLKGKTVYIPAGLSGTGSFGVQIAKNIFGAKVITTLSTRKISKAKELLGEGIPDQIVDYTKEDVGKVVHKGSVDFMFDSVKATLASVPLMKKDGVIVSVSEMPSGSLMKNNFPNVAGWMVVFLNVVDWCFRTWTSFKGVRYSYLFVKSNTKDLERLATWADEGKVNPVVGRQVKLSDLKRFVLFPYKIAIFPLWEPRGWELSHEHTNGSRLSFYRS